MSMGWYILPDDSGEPVRVDIETGARWMEASGERRILARTYIGEVMVSTVFLCIDHSWSGGAPVLWETLVFGGPLNGEGERYRSREAALKGHTEMVKRVIEAGDS